MLKDAWLSFVAHNEVSKVNVHVIARRNSICLILPADADQDHVGVWVDGEPLGTIPADKVDRWIFGGEAEMSMPPRSPSALPIKE
jgi:hypothetical protein